MQYQPWFQHFPSMSLKAIALPMRLLTSAPRSVKTDSLTTCVRDCASLASPSTVRSSSYGAACVTPSGLYSVIENWTSTFEPVDSTALITKDLFPR